MRLRDIKNLPRVGEIGPIPYDWRRPTKERFLSRVWNPEAPFLTKRWFGWGWDFNLYTVFHPLKWRRTQDKS